ncbi:MAG: PorT family protein [Bacteroidales bacterium]|nr:PorT family protein [Bacteroidales bacterium]MCM1146304.1 PorT family protein [Bacteroidales bacterium]MCM1205258.1 PorT family protein [Bacillota bacterium]MCM1509657.1 PorT family protein [Clostridium sp.]
MMMKRFLMLWVMVLTCVCSFAQSFDYGATGGISLSCPQDVRSRFGFNVGVKGELAFSDADSYLYLSTGLSFASRGWVSDIYTDAGDRRLDWKWDIYYMELPAMLGVKYGLNDYSALSVEAGPYVAYKLWHDARSSLTDCYDMMNIDTDIPGCITRFDYGLKAYVGVDYGKWEVGVGCSFSLQKPVSEKYAYLANPKDRSVSLKLTYMFSR